MKILVIQLARLGDIYQSWPALRALKRTNPEAEIHVLSRPRFQGAFEGLDVVSQVHSLPSAEILKPYMAADTSVDADVDTLTPRDQLALARTEQFLRRLENENYTRIINLSFSPLSADITFWLTADQPEPAVVAGYTRFDDGHLNLPDAMSAYFFAQVGQGRGNRFHLAEIFGTLCEADLLSSDWRAPLLPDVSTDIPEEFIAVHIGGSEAHKALSVSKWISTLRHLRTLRPFKFVLVGGKEDKGKGDQLLSVAPDGEVINLAGELSLMQTMAVIAKATLMIGPDSAPVHMASLTATPTLNLSVGQVNYWETGPRASGSVVLSGASEDDLLSSVIGDRVIEMVHGLRFPLGTIEVAPGAPSYTGATTAEDDFTWDMMMAIYQGQQFPKPVDELFYEGIKQLSEVNQFMIEQMAAVKTIGHLQDRNELLKRGEEVIEAIAKLVPSLTPLVRWYQVEKVRIGPIPLDQILKRNLEIQNLLQGVLEIYSPANDSGALVERDAV